MIKLTCPPRAALTSVEIPSACPNTAVKTLVTNSASAEVFALPELLEVILIHVSTFTKDVTSVTTPSTDYYAKVYEGPAKDLFVLQRVNSTFKATIARNKTMQQRMFLEATPGPFVKPPKGTARKDPFQWMLADIGIVVDSLKRVKGLDLLGKPRALTAYPAWPRERDLSDNALSEEASWRKMKLHHTERLKPIEFRLDSREKEIEVAKFAEEDGMTLGKLYNGLEVLVPLLGKVDAAQLDFYDGEDSTILFLEKRESAPKSVLKRRMEVAEKELTDEIARDDLWT